MRKFARIMKPAAVAFVALAATAGGAAALSKSVKKACGLDYQDFCAQYDPDSAAARACFESNRRSLSKGCVRALVDAGEVPRKYLKK